MEDKNEKLNDLVENEGVAEDKIEENKDVSQSKAEDAIQKESDNVPELDKKSSEAEEIDPERLVPPEDMKKEEEPVVEKKGRSKNFKLKVYFYLFIVFGIFTLIALIVLSVRTLMKRNDFLTTNFTQTIENPKEEFIIDLSNVDLAVFGSSGDQIEISLSGPDYRIDSLILDEGRKSNNLSQSFFDDFSLVNWLSDETIMTGEITIPSNMKINVKISGIGEIDFEKISAEMEMDLSGRVDAEIGNAAIKNAKIKADGTSQISVDECRGDLSLTLKDSSRVLFYNCVLENLDLDASGSTNVEIRNGSIEEAKVKLSGSSTVTIPKVSSKLDQTIEGAAQLDFN